MEEKDPKAFFQERKFSFSELSMSPIKKERLKKQQKELIRQQMRESLPVLTKQEIRRRRAPYHEALLSDLQESGFVNTAHFVTQLIQYQEKYRNKSGPGTTIWLRPQLKESKENLNLVVETLSNAETAHNAENFAKEWDEILRLAAHFAFGTEDWWWLGEQLLYQCVSMQYSGDFKKQEAIAYFIIGKYLVENGKKTEAGRFYLDLARQMSRGQSWNCSKILNQKQDLLFFESCRLLYKSLCEEVINLMKTNPKRALEVAKIARKRALESCDYKNAYQALLLLGRCLLLLKKSVEAIATVLQALQQAIRRKDIEAICEARIALALAYLQHKKPAECLECLKEIKSLAEEHNLPFYVAQSYRFMGEYYLNQKLPYEATPLLLLAFYLFHNVSDFERRDKVRTWAAISAGEELFPAYIELLQNCGDPNCGHQYLLDLINWIDEKKFFWTQDTKFAFSFTSLQKLLEPEK